MCCAGGRMSGSRRWLALAVLQCVLLAVSYGKHHHRRSMASQQSIPLSKGGWRPVIGSNGFVFGLNTAPLHAPSYKIPVPVYESYASSTRPLMARDANKVTSIAQSYRPTTLRSIVTNHPSPAASQPINTYFNPFANNNGLTHYKFFQNFPSDSVLIRNPHNPYVARPVFGKYPPKFKQPYPMQQLNNVQPIHFGQYNTVKPGDVFGKPVDTYAKPVDMYTKPVDTYAKPGDAYAKPAGTKSSNTEIFKPEVYKLPDSDSAPQPNTQQVKTAQQQAAASPKAPVTFPQYAYQDALLQPNILGTYGNFNFGVQQVKGGNQFFPAKTTFIPPQTSKQTLFNSFSFAPNFKTTPIQFPVTTPKLQATANQVVFGSNWNDYKNVPTQATKLSTPAKINPNLNKGTFKPSPQDPFIKHYNSDYNKVVNHLPSVQATTFAYSNFHDYKYQTQAPLQNSAVSTAPVQNFEQPNTNYNSENKKQKIHDSVAAGVNQQASQQYVNPPKTTEKGGNKVPFKPTYEVTESYDDIITHASSPAWPAQDSSDYKSTEEYGTKQEYEKKQEYETYSKPTTTPLPDLPEELAIVTEGYENSLSYDSQVESQSRRPVGDDFEPIGKHKLKDYYYRVSTPAYDDYSSRRTKKPTESSKPHVEVTTHLNKQSGLKDALPTLPPNQHFKRPSTPAPAAENVDKDRVRKRNKIRRRRPPLANIKQDNSTTRKYTTSTEAPHVTEESHSYRPRVRPPQLKQPSVTAPTITTDFTTSAIPTISPTNPTIVKKKLANRRPITTTEKYEGTTADNKDYDLNRESPIMKIAASSRPQVPKLTSAAYEYRTSETPDYSHKQDEKDTPTSDIAVSLSGTLKTTLKNDTPNNFSFHRDAKPIESNVETVTIREITTDFFKDSSEDATEIATTANTETTENNGKRLKPRLKNKYDRPRFSVKDYRNRLSSTTSTTEKPAESQGPRLRFPQRRVPEKLNDSENTTERKKFTPKDPRHKFNGTENNEQTEREIHSIRPHRQKQTTTEASEGTTQKMSSRIRNGVRRPKPTEKTTETVKPTTVGKRPLRKKIKDSNAGESTNDVTVTENFNENRNDMTSERTRSESAIMKIAEKKHPDNIEHLFEHSKRVSDLTLAASKDYNTPGMFKTVATNSRRIPNYFTIATDDPILPIEAFFPQINQKKES